MNNLATTSPGDLTAHVSRLLEKYGKPAPQEWRLLPSLPPSCEGALTLVPGWTLPEAEPEALLPLLPWRMERRFQELRRIIENQTLESLSMCRFSCLTDGREMDLAAVLYREFDLAEWLTGSTIVAVTASMQGNRWANVVLKMASGVLCGVEAGAALPPGAAMLDRHELIARRGVACDRLVDSQVPQSSVYTFTGAGSAQYTDTDAELFGLEQAGINLVRAAYDALVNGHQPEALRRQHRRLAGLVRLALESDRRGERLITEELLP